MQNAQRYDFNGLTTTGVAKTANGAAFVALPDAARTFSIMVKGVGGVPTASSVTLEGSLDGVNWTVLGTHTQAADGQLVFVVDKPVTFLRVNVGTLTLAPATALNVSVLATN